MNRFKVTHPWKATGNTLPMVYDTCPVTKNFTFKLPGGCASMEFIYDFFSTSKGQICVAFLCELQHFGPGKEGYKGIQVEYFPKNFWVFR